MMNKTIFEDKWKLIRAQSTARWSLMADFDLHQAAKAEVYFSYFIREAAPEGFSALPDA